MLFLKILPRSAESIVSVLNIPSARNVWAAAALLHQAGTEENCHRSRDQRYVVFYHEILIHPRNRFRLILVYNYSLNSTSKAENLHLHLEWYASPQRVKITLCLVPLCRGERGTWENTANFLTLPLRFFKLQNRYIEWRTDW